MAHGSSSFVPPPPEEETLFLSREGKELEIDLPHVTPAMVARAFEVDISTVWLRELNGQRAFFPDVSNSRFLFSSDVGVICFRFQVEGSPTAANNSLIGMATPPSVFSPRNPLVAHTKRVAIHTANVKIIQASLRRNRAGKPDFVCLSSTYIEITESTANVHNINQMIRNKWGENHVIVSSDGLEIEDSVGTQGLKFWKVGSRKVYAVKQEDLTKRKRSINIEEVSDDEVETGDHLLRKSELLKEIHTMKKSIDSIVRVNDSLNVPIAVRRVIKEAFSCHICQSFLKPPIIFTKCCRYILGCQQCVDTWYSGDDGRTKNCPRCRAERGFAETCQLNGLDEFLEGIQHSFSD